MFSRVIQVSLLILLYFSFTRALDDFEEDDVECEQEPPSFQDDFMYNDQTLLAPATLGDSFPVRPVYMQDNLAPTPGDPVPNQFFVHLNPGVDRTAHMARVRVLMADGDKRDGMTSRVVLEGPLFEKLSMYGGVFGPSVIDAISKSPDVKSVAPNTWTELDSAIPTPIVGNATMLVEYETTQTNTWALHRLNNKNRPVAMTGDRSVDSLNWPFKNYRNAGQGINVYIIDTGVNDHTALAGRITRLLGANVDPNAQPNELDDSSDSHGHGTRMAGIIAGQQVGVARSANIIPVKAGRTNHVSQMGVINGLNFALQHATQAHGGHGVISISVGMLKNQPDNMLQVVQAVLAAGLHIVNSAGNGSTDRCAVRIGTRDGPAGRGPITVGNMDTDDYKVSDSNYGACLTVFAPGNRVLTTDWNNANNFIQGSGTSEATAHTSGLVATLLSAGYRTPREIKAKIICLSVNVPRIIERLEDPRGTTIRLIQAPRPLFG
ncbi:peptidase S8/S53 domain-containing protein [Mycena leptocephala]|nr:peptidase S8/S53 domain-containing protein [Mycena leptocephala]